jgi:NAD(P)-dependent dehydrogenase (short-subunit alcohol dehydrogenase family)
MGNIASAVGVSRIAPRLENRKALVTGAASGIGLAVAQRLCAEGARVVLSDVRQEELAAVLSELGDCAVGIACDVGSEASVEKLVHDAVDWLGGLDIVVTSAGVVRTGTTPELPLDVWDLVIRVNLTGTFLVLKHSLKPMRKNESGSIVTIGSVASVVAAGRTCAYDASKGGVLQLTRAIAVENADKRIRANCVLPGIVRTPLAANSIALYGEMSTDASKLPASRVQVPMARDAAPSEIAAVVAFLASDDASFITGAAITADGGYTAI